jgi:hypothetical protein
MKPDIRRWIICFAGVMGLSGCGAMVAGTFTAANQLDQARDKARRNDLAAQHLDDIKQRQAKGDPLGDYLWAEANEKQIVPNAIQDPATIRRLYQVAADKGSVDAKLVLAVKQFKEGSYPMTGLKGIEIHEQVTKQQNRPIHPNVAAAKKRLEEDPSLEYTPLLNDLAEVPIREAAWRKGMKKTEEASQQRCFFYYSYFFAPRQKRCLAPRIAADEIWPAFRDGGSYPKDKTLRDHWYDQAIACEQTLEYQKAVRRCPVFGDDNYRFKGKD